MFNYVSPEKRVPEDHPSRRVRKMSDQGLAERTMQFSEIYSRHGRASIAPQKLLRALVLQAL